MLMVTPIGLALGYPFIALGRDRNYPFEAQGEDGILKHLMMLIRKKTLTEIDVQNLHWIIMNPAVIAGKYTLFREVPSAPMDFGFLRRIGGPFLLKPIEAIPRLMRDFAEWLATCPDTADLVLDYALSKLLGRPDLEALYGLGQRTGSDPLIKLVKPHGSLNFIGRLVIPYGDPGPYGHPFETKEPEIPRADSGDVCYWDGGDPTKEPCIVPPVASKPDALKVLGLTFVDGIRDAEKRAISSADEVYIIGWSIPQTDEDQREMIRESIRGRTLQQLVVVNRGAPPAYFFGVADLFGVDIKDMKIYTNGFCDYVEEIGLLPQEEATR
jgi:hypothetical protein